jgi:two-component system, OmpR family, sensor kinase ParS
MLRLYFGLFIMLAVGLVASLEVVDRTFNALLDGTLKTYNRDAVRGPAYSLAEQLRPLDKPARAQQIQQLQPHYGLQLGLVEAGELALSDTEKAELANHTLVVRKNYTRFISRIDDSDQLLSIEMPPETQLNTLYMVAAYSMLGVLLGIVLFFWVRPGEIASGGATLWR